MVRRVRHINVTRCVHCHALRPRKSRDGGELSLGNLQHAVAVRDVEVPRRLHRHPGGSGQRGAGGSAAGACGTPGAVSRHRSDHAIRHHAHAIVARIRDVEIARSHSHAGCAGDTRGGRHAAIALIAHTPIARRRTDDPVHHPAHAIQIGDIQVAGAIHGQPVRSRQLRFGGGAVISQCGTAAGEGGNHPARDLAHPQVRAVGHVDIARRIYRPTRRCRQLRTRRRAIVAAQALRARTRQLLHHAAADSE